MNAIRISLLVTLLASGPVLAAPLISGVIEDVDAQTIEMPSLPGAWQRRIEWMVAEGTEVTSGDLIIRLDPGSLISEEEKARVDLEKTRFGLEKTENQLKLESLDALRAVREAESAVKVAELDAVIPADTIPRLDYDRNQLTLATAKQTLARNRQALINKRKALADQQAQAELELRQAEVNYQRIREALTGTEIYAEKSGYMIYGNNDFTGKKVFPGDTLFSGFMIASVAGREDLRVKLWVHEADFLDIKTGQRIDVMADAEGTANFSAIIERRSNQAIEKQDWSDSGYFEAIAKPVGELPASIMPGMSVLGVPDLEEAL